MAASTTQPGIKPQAPGHHLPAAARGVPYVFGRIFDATGQAIW